MPETKITDKTWISLGLVITIAGMALSFGILFQKVENVREDIGEMKIQIAEIRSVIIKAYSYK